MSEPGAPPRVRSRAVSGIAALLLVTAAVLAASGALLWRDQGRLGLEAPLALLFALAAWYERRAWVVVDADGVGVVHGWRRSLYLWPAIESVTIDVGHRLASPLHLDLRRGGHVTPRGCWGLSRARRAELEASVRLHAATHGVLVVHTPAAGTAGDGSDDGSDGAVGAG